MPRHEDLPHLIALLEDESPLVQEAILRELSEFGEALPDMLDQITPPPSAVQQARLRHILETYLQRRLRQAWPQWLNLEDDTARLEAALSMLAEFQNGPAYPFTLKDLLDGLASDFFNRYGRRDAQVLARFLFEELGFAGDRKEYHSPRNSNLVRVIETRRGLPIALACVFILVGRRLEMDVRGINWPENFLVRAMVNGKESIFDPFNYAPGMDRESFLKMQGPSRDAAEAILNQVCDAPAIVARVLRNLSRAYELEGALENAELMIALLDDLQRRTARR